MDEFPSEQSPEEAPPTAPAAGPADHELGEVADQGAADQGAWTPPPVADRWVAPGVPQGPAAPPAAQSQQAGDNLAGWRDPGEWASPAAGPDEPRNPSGWAPSGWAQEEQTNPYGLDVPPGLAGQGDPGGVQGFPTYPVSGPGGWPAQGPSGGAGGGYGQPGAYGGAPGPYAPPGAWPQAAQQGPYAESPYQGGPAAPYGSQGSWDSPGWTAQAGPGGPGGPLGPGTPGPLPGAVPWGYGWQPAPPPPKRSVPVAVAALLLTVALLVGLGIGHGVWKDSNASNSASSSFGTLPTGSGGTGNGSNGTSGNGNTGNGASGNGSSGNTGNGTGGASGSSSSLAAVAAAAAPALVDINTTINYDAGEAAGTGIVLTQDGYVLTNNHVISQATSITVTDVGNGHTYTGQIVGYDRTDDVALIKLQGASGLSTAKLGDSSKVNVGQGVVGIGNAGGVGGTPSSATGTVTGLGQSITAQDESNGTSEQLTGLIQTDANIQPGDSGGALVDAAGQVIGMDTAASEGFSFESQGNQGFAIPINTALDVAGEIRSGTTSSKIHIGATAFLGVVVGTQQSGVSGAPVSSVLPNEPAAQAGLGGGDVITSLDGASVSSPDDLTSLMSRYHPGDKVTVGWTDSSGQTHTATVQLASGPAA